MKRFIIAPVLFAVFLAFEIPDTLAVDKIPVFVSIPPQKYFVEKIGGRRVDVSVMVEPGASPHTYEPRPRQMAKISQTRIYFAVGVFFEKAWLGKIAAVNPKMRLVHTDEGIQKIIMKSHHHPEAGRQHRSKADREQDKDDAHPAEGTQDPHIWLSPPLVMIQAKNMLAGLLSVDPDHASVYRANYQDFLAEIKNLDAEIRTLFAGTEGQAFMVFHPSWGYFADTYRLVQIPIEIEGKAPKPAQLIELIETARTHGIRTIFVQPQISSKSARLIAGEIQGQVIVADPLAEDWADNLREVAKKFKATLR